MFQIVWSKTAIIGYASILSYLDKNWTIKEINNFENEVNSFLERLKNSPYLLQYLDNKVRRGPINPLTVLTYQVNEDKKEIQLLSLRSSRQKPL